MTKKTKSVTNLSGTNETTTTTTTTTTRSQDNDATNFLLHPTKSPSRIFGPLVAYTNPASAVKNASTDLQNLSADPLHVRKKPLISPEENPYYHHKTAPDLQNVETLVTTLPPKTQKSTKHKTKPPIYATPPSAVPSVHEELLHIISQHPHLATIPPGSVLEVHNVPANHPALFHPFDQLLQEIHQQATYHNNNNVTMYPGGSYKQIHIFLLLNVDRATFLCLV